jgi:predicted phosphodiesterase
MTDRWLVLPDIHCPAHNRVLIKIVLRYLRYNRNKYTGVLFTGDFLDLPSISAHNKGLIVGMNLDREYEIANELLDLFDEAIGEGKKKVFLYGNHEGRFKRESTKLEISKYGKSIRDIRDALDLDARGYTVYDNPRKKAYHMLGDVKVIHGVYYNIHAAKKHTEVYKCNILFGHTHRHQVFDEGKYCAYNIGWMGDVEHDLFDYAEEGTKSYWVNSFGLVDVHNGKASVQIIKFIDNRYFIIDGEVFE